MRFPICALAALFCVSAHAQGDLKQGQWDGKTASAKLDVPYEDPHQVPPQFGILSYFNLPWRGYMDTWPASKWNNVLGVGWGGKPEEWKALAQLMDECGMHFARVEIGWGSVDWNDELSANARAQNAKLFAIFKKHGIRPLILLNAHHGVPGPMKSYETQLMADAAKGERTIKIKPDTLVKPGYTGLVNLTEYKGAFPLITGLDADGMATLSAPLPKDLKAGKLPLQELKYQPFQGAKLKNGTLLPASQETLDGWLKYVRAVGNLARETLGSDADSGFDIEVWNEQTFGSDFLDINRYYEPKIDIEPLIYRKTRVWSPKLRPDAKLEFEQRGFEILLPMTVEFFNDAQNGFTNVVVMNGFSSQVPWGSGATQWDGQGGLSKHYYTGTTLREASPQTPLGHKDSATVDALNHFDGQKDPNNREWHGIIPGTNFIPKVTLSLPEWPFCAFQTETIQRDLFPDSRLAKGIGGTPSGRYTHNGDWKTPRYWQTEVNYDRSAFIERVKKESGAKDDDARLIALNDATNSKHMLRQYVFQAHKGMDRIYLFSLNFDEYSIGLLPRAFYQTLGAAKGELTPAVRATVPRGWQAVKWVSDLMKSGAPLDATRALRVDELVEHKPRLVFAGDGTTAHPSKYHRDYFAFLPFQLTPQKYAIAFYVATPNATQAWDATKDALDPTRYDLPDQDFDVSIGNIAGRGAKISAFDPIKSTVVPVKVLASSPNSLQVRLPSTDYPRFLIVDEAQPGPQIIAPKISATPGQITLQWQTNLAPGAVRVSYGRDWQLRDVNEVKITPTKNQRDFSITLPTGDADIVAARIRIASNGLSTVWPRWDEDPAGQITMPNAKPRPANQAAALPAPAAIPLVNWEAPPGIALPVSAEIAGVVLKLPAGAEFIGPADERTLLLGKGAEGITLHAQMVPRGAKNASDYLPFAAAIDNVTHRGVKLPSGIEATAVDFAFEATAHPGLSALHQRFLLIPRGDDLLLLSATGTPAAMTVQTKTIDAIWAGVSSR